MKLSILNQINRVAACLLFGVGGLTHADTVSLGSYTGIGQSNPPATLSNHNAINTGQNLSEKGGLVLLRSSAERGVQWIDSVQGADKYTDSTESSPAYSTDDFAFTDSGFTVTGTAYLWNKAGLEYNYLSLQEKPGFLDIVRYSGNQDSARGITHNLGKNVGMVIIKTTDTDLGGVVWHKSLSSNTSMDTLWLFGDGDKSPSSEYGYVWGNTQPTVSEFYVGASAYTNGAGKEYVAYVFADNPEGGVAVGSYQGSGADGVLATLPWQPDSLILKPLATNHANNWTMWSPHLGGQTYSILDRKRAGYDHSAGTRLDFKEQGDVVKTSLAAGHEVSYNQSGKNYLYIAFKDTGDSASGSEEANPLTITTVDDAFEVDAQVSTRLDVLVNDVFPEGVTANVFLENMDSTSFSVSVVDQEISFIATEPGTYSFAYYLQDATGAQSLPATVTVEVSASSLNNLTRSDSFVAVAGATQYIPILANDLLQGQQYHVDIPSSSALGAPVDFVNGMVVYQAEQPGTDSFVYSVTAQNGQLLGLSIVDVHVVEPGTLLPTMTESTLSEVGGNEEASYQLSFAYTHVEQCVLLPEKNTFLEAPVTLLESSGANQSGELTFDANWDLGAEGKITVTCITQAGASIDKTLVLAVDTQYAAQQVAVSNITITPERAMVGEAQVVNFTYHNATSCKLPGHLNSFSFDFPILEAEQPESGALSFNVGDYPAGQYGLTIECSDNEGNTYQQSSYFTRNLFTVDKHEVWVGEENTLKWNLPNISYCDAQDSSNVGETSFIDVEAVSPKVIKRTCTNYLNEKVEFSTVVDVKKLKRPEGLVIEGAN